MIEPTIRVDVAALEARLGIGAPDSKLRQVGTREIVVGRDALEDLPGLVGARTPAGGSVVVLVDATPIHRGGDDLKTEVVRRLAVNHDVRLAVLGDDRPELHADELALAEADAAIADAATVVAVGSGTITDIAKDATHRRGDPPLVVVQTAVSVNAFADNMAVLVRNGVKRTVPSRWPDALVVDLAVLADTPLEMNQAGYGELTSMFTAPADWHLATLFGMDDSFDERVLAAIRERGPELLAIADGVAGRRDDALASLADLMTLSGIAMGVVGRTAVFSGMEHTVSHLLDMRAERAGRPLAFHGAQVGVAAVLEAIAWRRFLDGFDPERLLASSFPDAAAMEARVRAAFLPLDPTGRLAEECWRDYGTKLARWTGLRERMPGLVEEWPAHRARLEALLVDPAELVAALRRAGAATRARDLDPPADEPTLRWALESCHLMRDRFTIADLAFLTGAWDGDAVEAVLADAARLGAGA